METNKQRTVLQSLIIYIKTWHPVQTDIINKINNLLPDERNHIEQAYLMGQVSVHDNVNDSNCEDAKEYFNSTYK